MRFATTEIDPIPIAFVGKAACFIVCLRKRGLFGPLFRVDRNKLHCMVWLLVGGANVKMGIVRHNYGGRSMGMDIQLPIPKFSGAVRFCDLR